MDMPIDTTASVAPTTRPVPQLTLAMLDDRPGFFADEPESLRPSLERAFNQAGGSLTPLQICELAVPRPLRLRILLHPTVFSRVERSELACEFAARVLDLCDNGWLREALVAARKWRQARQQLAGLDDDRFALASDDERLARQYLNTCRFKVLVLGVQLGVTATEQRVIRAVAAAASASTGPIAPGQDAAWVAAYHAASAWADRNPKRGAFAEEMLVQLGLVRRALVRCYGQPE